MRIRHPPRNVSTDTNGSTEELIKIIRKAQLHTNTASGYPTLKKKRANNSIINVKQLLDEVEHDIMNYQNRGLCYLPKPKAKADNTDMRS